MLTQEQIDQTLLGIYDGVFDLDTLPYAFFKEYFDTLIGGVLKGMRAFDFETPYHELATHFKQNIYIFSGAKTWQEIYDVQKLIVGKDGFKVPFYKFLPQAQAVHTVYSEAWLKTEYETAYANAESADRWLEFEAEKKQFPYLQYKTVGDGRVRDSHQKLHNIIRPVGDKFWSEFVPTNGFNCRCTYIQLTKEEAEEEGITKLSKEKYADIKKGIPPLFRFNPAKDKYIFDDKHPYFSVAGKRPLVRDIYSIQKANGFGMPNEPVEGIDFKGAERKVYTDYDEAVRETEKWYKGLTPQEQVIARQYTDKGDVIVNNYFRTNMDYSETFDVLGEKFTLFDIDGNALIFEREVTEYDDFVAYSRLLAKQTKQVYESAPLFTGTTYRGINSNTGLHSRLYRDVNGSIFTEEGFMSTSYSYDKAEEYSGGTLVMTIEKVQGVATKSFSNFPEDDEILAMPNSSIIKIGREEDRDGITQIKFSTE